VDGTEGPSSLVIEKEKGVSRNLYICRGLEFDEVCADDHTSRVATL
jgi:hypothetical protein